MAKDKIKTYYIQDIDDYTPSYREYSFAEVKDYFSHENRYYDYKDYLEDTHDKYYQLWKDAKDVDDIMKYLEAEYEGMQVPYKIVEAGERPAYKEKSISLGGSDIAALVAVGIMSEKLNSQIIKFGSDGSYKAWYVTAEEVEIPKHYEKVGTFNWWLKIYDDEGLVYKSDPDKQYFEIYRAGDFGITIKAFNKIPEKENE